MYPQVDRQNSQSSNDSRESPFYNEMIINFYILCPLVINRIEGEVQSLRVIRHKFHRISLTKLYFLQERFELQKFTYGTSHSLILGDEDIISKDSSEVLQGLRRPMAKARAKKDKKALNQMVTNTMEVKPKLEGIEPKLVNYICPHENDMGARDAVHLHCF